MQHIATRFVLALIATLASSWSHADPCDPARVPDLDGLSPISTVESFGRWDPDWKGPLAERLVVIGDLRISNLAAPVRIAAWDGAQWYTFGPGLATSPAATASLFGKLIVAGSSISPVGGPSLGRMAQWNGSSWEALPSTIPAGSVSAMRVHDDWLYVGGGFNTAGSTAVVNVARWNGITWQALGSGLNASVSSFEVLNQEIIAGGSFTQSGSASVRHVARWNGQSWQPFANGPGGSVSGITVRDGHLIVIRGNQLSTWDGSQWSALSIPMNQWFGAASCFHANGSTLYVGGNFEQTGADPISSVAAWDGTSWSNMSGGLRLGGARANVVALSSFNGALYAGGAISHAAGTPANGVARWKDSSWQSIGSGWSKYAVRSIKATSDAVYACDVDDNLARWEDQIWKSLPSLPITNNSKQLFSLDGMLYAIINDSTIFRFHANQWTQIGEPLAVGVRTLVSYRGTLVAGGGFRTVNGIPFNGVAQWNGVSWQPMGIGLTSLPLGNPYVSSLFVFNNDLYAFGSFDHSGTTELQGFTRWNGTEWIALDTGGVPNPAFPLEYQGELVTLGNGAFRAWNGQSWRTIGEPFAGQIRTTKIYKGRLLAGGRDIGPSKSDLVQWNGSSWQPFGPVPSFAIVGSDPFLSALEVFNGDLMVGGFFECVENRSAFNFAMLSACALCPADFDGNALIDDADFVLFLQSYDLLDCSDPAMPHSCVADINSDGGVDDLDFATFAAAYDALLCF